MTFKVMIHDLVVLWREIEIPERCPGFVSEKNDTCNNDLTQDASLRVFEYQDQSRRARLVKNEDGSDDLEWSDFVGQGDDYIEVGYCCAKCDHEFENGGFIRQECNAALWTELEKLVKEKTL
jgi:hypothetical protein